MTYWANLIFDSVFPGLFEAENDDLEILKDTATKLKLHELANDIEKSKRRSSGKNRNKNKSKSDTCTIKRVTNLQIYHEFIRILHSEFGEFHIKCDLILLGRAFSLSRGFSQWRWITVTGTQTVDSQNLETDRYTRVRFKGPILISDFVNFSYRSEDLHQRSKSFPETERRLQYLHNIWNSSQISNGICTHNLLSNINVESVMP